MKNDGDFISFVNTYIWLKSRNVLGVFLWPTGSVQVKNLTGPDRDFENLITFFQECDHKIYKISGISQTIFANYGLKWPYEPRKKMSVAEFSFLSFFTLFSQKIVKTSFFCTFSDEKGKKKRIKSKIKVLTFSSLGSYGHFRP